MAEQSSLVRVFAHFLYKVNIKRIQTFTSNNENKETQHNSHSTCKNNDKSDCLPKL